MNQIPLYYYIAFNNPDGAKSVIESFGYEVYNVKNRSDLAQCVKQLVQERGEDAITALAKVHPDRDLILQSQDSVKTLSADGDPVKLLDAPVVPAATQPIIKSSNDYTPVLLAGMFLSAIIVTAAIIVKK